jgi:hypothetical protein
VVSGLGAEGRKVTGVLDSTCPVEPVLEIGGVETIIPFERITHMELKEER